MTQRLDKFIATQKSLPRSEVRRLISKGAVRVDGAVVRKADTQIDPTSAEISLLGQIISSVPWMDFPYSQ